MDLVDAVAFVHAMYWAEVRAPQSAAMDSLLRGQLGLKRSGTIALSMVSSGDPRETTGACSSLLVPFPSLLLRPSLLPRDSPSQESFLLSLSSSLA